MSNNKSVGDTSSFLLRITQHIFEDDLGESQVQWRGTVRHVQEGDERKFSEFHEVIDFIHQKLAAATARAIEDKSTEQKENILEKSFSLWKRLADAQTRMISDTIKDPKTPIRMIQEVMSQVGERIEQDIKAWKPVSQAEYGSLVDKLDLLQEQMEKLSEQIQRISPKGE